MIKTVLSEICGKPIICYEQKKGDLKVLLTGGMHHYENTVAHLEELIKIKDSCFNGLHVYIIPDSNPANFLGLNRTFNPKDVPAEYGFLRNLNPFDLSIDFHSDFEARKFYLYERNRFQNGFGSNIYELISNLVPVDGFGEVDIGEHTLEEFNYELGTNISITTETPLLSFSKENQVKFNKILTRLILSEYKQLMEVE